jgi:hypothetical protein
MNEYKIRVTLKTHNRIFKPTFRSEEFYLCAESRDQAIVLASSSMKSKGYPHDETFVQVLSAIPLTAIAAIRYCMECRKPTTGSIGQAGFYWSRLCQPCKDYADGVLRTQIRTQAMLARVVDRIVA